MHSPTISVTVGAMRKVAAHVVAIDLRASDGAALPKFGPGAHIDLHLADDLVRSYSLLNDGRDGCYTVAVLNDKHSRGGSRHVHEKLAVGAALQISSPRNHFPLNEAAAKSILVAGGIGVTPILSMRHRLLAQHRPLSMFYAARSREEAAFYADLADAPEVSLHFDNERGGPPDLTGFLRQESPESHFYCCGPASMIAAFEEACAALGFKNVHIERFSAGNAVEVSQDGVYQVSLARSGKVIEVVPGVTLLDAVERAGVRVDSACHEGICGACETRVLEGTPDHRDLVLSDAERESNKTMLICVSGCIGGRLVLDL